MKKFFVSIFSVILIGAGVGVAFDGAGASTAAPYGPSAPAIPAGYPTVDSTGVQPSHVLQDVPSKVTSGPGWHWVASGGYVAVDGSGTASAPLLVKNLRIDGSLDVYGNYVTLANNDVRGITPHNGNINLVIRHNTIHGTCLDCADRLTYGVMADNCQPPGGINYCPGLDVGYNEFYWVQHPMQGEGGNWHDNFVHWVAHYGSCQPGGPCDHTDVFFSGGGTDAPLTIRHNTLLNDQTTDGTTASIMLNNAFGQQIHRTIDDNFMAGGNYAVYGGDGAAGGGSDPGDPGYAHDVKITNNQCSTFYVAKCGYYGPIAYGSSTGDNVFTNNRFSGGPNDGKVYNSDGAILP